MGILHRDSAVNHEGVEVRYISELRFDGERTITGTAMRYGDTAELPWGDRERFEPGAFGDVERADVVLNVQHQRGSAVARTGGGGMTLTDGPSELRMSAILANTADAKDAIEKVRSKILRGLSVEFVPVDWKKVREGNADVMVIQKAELRGIGIVDRPAYNQSRLSREDAVDQETIKRWVQDALQTRDGNTSVDVDRLVRSLADGLKTSVNESIKVALQERDDEAKKRREAEEASQKATEDANANAEARAELLVLAKPLLKDDFEARGKSNKDILVAAVGDEVSDAEKRSEDYLLARLETIAERREEADKGIRTRAASAGQGGGKPTQRRSTGAPGIPLNPYSMPRPPATSAA